VPIGEQEIRLAASNTRSDLVDIHRMRDRLFIWLRRFNDGVAPMLLCLGLALCAGFYRPGDVSLGADEAALLGRALNANAGFRLADVGLTGTAGMPYGPLPTQLSQLLLLITHDPVTFTSIRATLFILITSAGLFAWSRATGLTNWLAPAFCALPWVWMHARQPWDNSLLIPASAATFAGLAWWRRGSSLGGFACVAGAASMLSVHLMSLPVVAAIGIHLLVSGRSLLWRSKLAVATALLASVALNHGYLQSARRTIATRHESPTTQTNNNAITSTRPMPSRVKSSLIPISARPITLPTRAGLNPSWAATASGWLGMALPFVAAVAVLALRKGQHESQRDASITGLSSIGLSSLMFAALQTEAATHYQHATLVPLCLLATVAVGRLPWKAARAVILASAVVSSVSLLPDVPERVAHEPTLSDLCSLASRLDAVGVGAITTDVPFLRQQPNVLWTIRTLLKHAPASGTSTAQVDFDPVSRFTIRHADAPGAKTIPLDGPIDSPVYGLQ
jgi:hypothetical protein